MVRIHRLSHSTFRKVPVDDCHNNCLICPLFFPEIIYCCFFLTDSVSAPQRAVFDLEFPANALCTNRDGTLLAAAGRKGVYTYVCVCAYRSHSKYCMVTL